MPKRILVFFNSYWFNKDVLSGGIVRLIEIFKRLKINDLTCLTNQNGFTLFQKNKISVHFILTHRFFNKLTILPSYIMRTIQAVATLKGKDFDILYSSSDFFPDVIPAFFSKSKSNIWVQCIFHLYPHWKKRKDNLFVNLIGYYMQNFSFYFIKKEPIR